MKLEFQAKFLQHLNKKRQQDEGFTLIELLVVIIIIGILAAIALPSLLAQVNKAKQAEAKQNVGAMNRAQQAYYLEAGYFATDVVSLGIGIQTQSINYTYTIAGNGTAPDAVYNRGDRRVKNLKSYLGLNYTQVGGAGNTEALTLGRVCETLAPSDNVAGAPAVGTTSCPTGNPGYKDLGTGKTG